MMARQRCHDQDPVTVPYGQLVGWAAKIVRFSYEDDPQDALIALAVEIKTLASNAIEPEGEAQ